MRIVYLRAALADLVWMRTYYERIFPEGAERARESYRATLRTIADNPEIGHPFGSRGAREFPVIRSPFSIIYRARPSRIEVLRVWDNRSDPARFDL